jgi:hypothetical protein
VYTDRLVIAPLFQERDSARSISVDMFRPNVFDFTCGPPSRRCPVVSAARELSTDRRLKGPQLARSCPCARRYICRPEAEAVWGISDPGCVKTSQAPKCVEWLVPDRSKSTAPRNCHCPNCDPKSDLFYQFSIQPYFYTAKTLRRPRPRPSGYRGLGCQLRQPYSSSRNFAAHEWVLLALDAT